MSSETARYSWLIYFNDEVVYTHLGTMMEAADIAFALNKEMFGFIPNVCESAIKLVFDTKNLLFYSNDGAIKVPHVYNEQLVNQLKVGMLHIRSVDDG